LRVEDPSKRTLETNRSFPHFTSQIGHGGVTRCLNTGSIVKVVSIVAGQTLSVLKVPGLTLSIYELADAIGIEEGSEGALDTLSISVVFAVWIVDVGTRSIGRVWISDAFTVLDDVSIVAGSAGSIAGIPLTTLVIHCYTDVASISVVFSRAGDAGVVLPLSATDEARVGGGSSCTGTVGIDVISSIALLADSLSPVEYGTVLINFTAYAVIVEDVGG